MKNRKTSTCNRFRVEDLDRLRPKISRDIIGIWCISLLLTAFHQARWERWWGRRCVSSPGLQKKDLVNECQTFIQVSEGGLEGRSFATVHVVSHHTTFKARTSGLHIVQDTRASGPVSAGSHPNSPERCRKTTCQVTHCYPYSLIDILGVDMHWHVIMQ